jgi:hypothetical protein
MTDEQITVATWLFLLAVFIAYALFLAHVIKWVFQS